MRTSRFTDEQIVRIVHEVDAGTTWAEVSRRHGISRETLRRWRAKGRGMGLAEAKRLKAHSRRRIVGSRSWSPISRSPMRS